MTIHLDGVPDLDWTHGDGIAAATATGLALTAAGGSDWSNDSAGDGTPVENLSTSLSFDPGAGDFVLSARVAVAAPRTTFDAAVLTLWADDTHWAKLCFEQSPQGQAMVVSVVTNTFSDDANGPVVTGGSVWLRVARIGSAFAFHYSLDAVAWHFVRLFRIVDVDAVRVGLMSQAPHGPSAVASFDEVRFATRTLADLRDES